MARKDPSFLEPVPSARETKTFVDPRSPNDPYEFTFEVQDGAPEEYYLGDNIRRYKDRYLIQRGELKVRGTAIVFSESLVSTIVFLMMIDRTQDADGPPWTFEQWATFAVQCPSAWREVVHWAMNLRDKARGVSNPDSEEAETNLKNDLAADAASG